MYKNYFIYAKNKGLYWDIVTTFCLPWFQFTLNIILENNCCQKKSIDLKKKTFFNQHQTISIDLYLPIPIPIII